MQYIGLCPIIDRSGNMIEIKATPKFMRQAKKMMTEQALQQLMKDLTNNPAQGMVMSGTGGVRKLRFQSGQSNRGKSAGLRVLYYYDDKRLVLLLMLFQKSDQENIDAGEKETLKKLVPELLKRCQDE